MNNRDYFTQNFYIDYEYAIIGNSQSKRYMASKEDFNQAAGSIAALGRDELKKRIQNFRGRFKFDFTDKYLDELSVDRLRHMLLAALINAKKE